MLRQTNHSLSLFLLSSFCSHVIEWVTKSLVLWGREEGVAISIIFVSSLTLCINWKSRKLYMPTSVLYFGRKNIMQLKFSNFSVKSSDKTACFKKYKRISNIQKCDTRPKRFRDFRLSSTRVLGGMLSSGDSHWNNCYNPWDSHSIGEFRKGRFIPGSFSLGLFLWARGVHNIGEGWLDIVVSPLSISLSLHTRWVFTLGSSVCVAW